MKAKLLLINGLYLCLIWLPVIFLLPLQEVDIWNDNVDPKELLIERNSSQRLPRVLNFFPVPFVEECKSNDGRRRGICMNTYECRIQEGKSHGFCALGFGVCCVFTTTCSQEIFNNLTYFVNPNYPDWTTGMSSCQAKIKKTDPDIAQMRFDFIHFNLGQPNRTTGICEEDVFLLKSRNREFQLCGLNNGQHVYFDMEDSEELELTMTLSKKVVTRFWEIIVTQIPFIERTPPGCLQFFTGTTGVVQTMNFADNGRHLANQDYNICIRQEEGYCSIAYEPCHENAFRIAPNNEMDVYEEGSGDGDDLDSRSIDICNDKIVLPCDSDELIMPGFMDALPGSCSLEHCGLSLCPTNSERCRIESTATPFNIAVHFGPTLGHVSPDDNLGMCLQYEQQPCEY
ncbi:hypothetical protein ABEB36_009972 [Hypothenemus hampei]|uniref:CUB domain-containing protein n=1 Tax=Hypothenemus hampei TaxID=57062 RepID=A0ABD1EI30_HYPHA